MNLHPIRSLASGRRALGAISIGSLALALFATTACTQQPQISTQAAGHAVTARIKGNGTKVENRSDGALLSSEFGQVNIERTRMRIEGNSWVQISEGTPITLNIERGRITLNAGKVSVSRTVSY